MGALEMKKMIDKITWDTLKNEKLQFVIPMYQRKYAWSEVEVRQLLKDLEEWDHGNYFIGNIVVEVKNDGTYDVVDGQQRLTTLFLLCALSSSEVPFDLNYAIRENDKKFLKSLSTCKSKEEIRSIHQDNNADSVFYDNIVAIYKYFNEHNERLLSGKIMELLTKVEFIITRLHSDKFDIAKYFEVMNNRGKQLEKHEILKSYFLDNTNDNDQWNDEDRYTYGVIWDYCSRMDNYFEDFIYLYETKQDSNSYASVRQSIEYAFFERGKMEKLIKVETKKEKKITKESSISSRDSIKNLLEETKTGSESSRDGVDEYRSILKFPFFLLQVLNIFLLEDGSKDNFDIKYNDSVLIEHYKDNLNNVTQLSVEEKKKFIHFLFKMRVLFDYYIFRRTTDHEQAPYLKQIVISDIKKYEHKSEDFELVNIEILFNVTSDFFTQDWVAPALSFLNLKTKESGKLFEYYNNFRDFLNELDRVVAQERLGSGKLKEVYRKKIYDPYATLEFDNRQSFNNIINKGVSTEHYWFYKLDYLLWKDFISGKEYWKQLDGEFKDIHNSKINIKEFKLKNLISIEHIYPQHPNKESGNCIDQLEDWQEYLNNFGNLALISNHMNSKLSNQCFKEKGADIKNQLEKGTIESLKMLLIYAKYNEWTIVIAKEHSKKMVELLQDSI